MAGLYRPPFGEPTGPLLGDVELLTTYLAGARTGHSTKFHVEDDALLLDRLQPIALRVGPDSVLVRTDIHSGMVERVAEGNGLALIESDPPLATVVALQVLGMPAASWGLWAADPATGRQALASSAYQQQTGPPTGM